MNANASSGFSLALNHDGCDLADSDVSASSAAVWSSSSDEERRKAGKNKTKTVTGCDVWCREDANTCAEDEKQPWVNGEKKFVYHGARWLGSHARSSVAM